MTLTITRTEVLKGQFASTNAPLRPIVTYVNGDTSWLFSFPRPITDKSTNGKVYYHAVVDPWFSGPAILYTSYLMQVDLGCDPVLSSRAAIDTAIVEIELAAGNTLVSTDTEPAVDAIFITSILEHCVHDSLVQFSAFTPIFAVARAASIVSPWAHFNVVVPMSCCDPSKTPWEKGHPGSPLPSWLTVFPPTVRNFNNFGLAFITSTDDSKHEMILISPHGMAADEAALEGLAKAVKMLALIAPVGDTYSMGYRASLGVKDGLGIAQYAGTQYYVRHGDFVDLKYKGVLGWTVNLVHRDLQHGMDELRKEIGPEKEIKLPTMVEVENGGSYVLV